MFLLSPSLSSQLFVKLATAKTAVEDSGEGLLPGMGEDCCGVDIQQNLSGKVVLYTPQYVCTDSGVTEIIRRKEGREGGGEGILEPGKVRGSKWKPPLRLWALLVIESWW